MALFWSGTDGNLKQYGTIKPKETRRQHTFSGHVWVAKDDTGKLLGVFEAQDDESDAIIDGTFAPSKPQPKTERPKDPGTAFIRDYNVWLRSGDKEIQLTQDGSEENAFQSPFFWSPDGEKFVARQIKPAQEHKVYLVDSSPNDQVQPKLKTIDYLKPGDKIEQVRPRLFDAKNAKEISVSDDLFNNPWSISNIEWDKDSSAFSFLYNQRGHQVLRVLRVENNGAVKPIIEENSPTFVDYSQKTYFNRLDKTGEIIWASERDGFNHLYLFDASNWQAEKPNYQRRVDGARGGKSG